MQRRHVIDTCQLLNKARTFKYTAAQVVTLEQAAEHCREKAVARLQLFDWLLFNVLIGNGDNHLKNISFGVDSGGIHIAPAYDLLSTCAYDTRAFAHENAHWPQSPLGITLGTATQFAQVRRSHLIESARLLGIAASTAQRSIDRMLKNIQLQADQLIAEIQRANIPHPPEGPSSERPAAAVLAAETRLIDVIRHIVINDMVKQLT